MTHELKDGSTVEDPRLDRLYELDWRSLNYPVDKKLELTKPYSSYTPRSYTWSIDTTLDQGPDGACVGFAYAHDLRARPDVIEKIDGQPIDFRFAKERIYFEAQKIDEWAGGAYPGASPFYEGTSILAGAKIGQRLGAYDGYYWALNLHQLAIGVGYDGPCILGINWYNNMFYPDGNGFVVPGGGVAGGHAVLITGVKIVYKSWISKLLSRKWENVDLDRSYFTIKNSWGPGWGQDGFFKLSFRHTNKLLMEQGDACFPKRTYIYTWKS